MIIQITEDISIIRQFDGGVLLRQERRDGDHCVYDVVQLDPSIVRDVVLELSRCVQQLTPS